MMNIFYPTLPLVLASFESIDKEPTWFFAILRVGIGLGIVDNLLPLDSIKGIRSGFLLDYSLSALLLESLPIINSSKALVQARTW